jgi:hypothetical protein
MSPPRLRTRYKVIAARHDQRKDDGNDLAHVAKRATW